MEHLLEKLQQYSREDIYPYHMPGHKRRNWGELPRECYEIDITEIDGFDNLHQSEEILAELQQKAAQLYGAEESFYLVNGSTSGVLSAVSCALPCGGRILMARNCHRSAYHAAYLRNLKISYLAPSCVEGYDICEAVTAEQVRRALERETDVEAVLIVSPTYEGRVADVKAIARIVHEKGIPLIVDEAHGAHLGLAKKWPGNSCEQGADLVIHSVHKTLPALTQTALLHVNGKRIDRNLLRRFLRIYQSSSPSYLLMASIDNALQYVERQGEKSFAQFRDYFFKMMDSLKKCRNLKFLPRPEDLHEQSKFGQSMPNLQSLAEFGQPQEIRRETANREKTGKCADHDIGKLVISVKDTTLTGKQLYDILLQTYHMQTEMAAGSYVLAMFTVNDGEEAYRRMTEALLEIDGRISREAPRAQSSKAFFPTASYESGTKNSVLRADAIPLARAWDLKTETVPLQESIGRYAGEFVNLYPPGIPLLVPGEQITQELYEKISEYVSQGLNVQGIHTSGIHKKISIIGL